MEKKSKEKDVFNRFTARKASIMPHAVCRLKILKYEVGGILMNGTP